MKSKKIKLDNRTVKVERLPLGRYAELLKAFKKLPQSLREIQGKSNEEVVEQLPLIIGNSWDDFLDIISITTDLTKKEIKEELDLNQAVDIVLAVIEVNKYDEVYTKVKKAIAQPKAGKSKTK